MRWVAVNERGRRVTEGQLHGKTFDQEREVVRARLRALFKDEELGTSGLWFTINLYKAGSDQPVESHHMIVRPSS